MESRQTGEAYFSYPLFLRVLPVPTRVRLADCALALLAQQPVQPSSKRGAAIRKSPACDCRIQSGKFLFCQTHWYLNCHTEQYTEMGRKSVETRT
jgi:hypothetical protein